MIREERLHRVEIALRERVELVIVTLGAPQRAAQPHRRHRAHAIGAVLGEIFLGLQPALGGSAIQTIVGRRHPLLHRGVGHQIAGQLFAREFVERLVVAESMQHVVAVRPGGKGVVAVESAGIGVAHHVQPAHRLLLRIARRGQQAIHQLLVRVGRRVLLEGRDFLGCRRNAGEIQRHAASQRAPVGLRRRLQPFPRPGVRG